MNHHNKTMNSQTPEFFIKHKEHFDMRLIQAIENSEKRNCIFKQKVQELECLCSKSNMTIKELTYQKKDVEIINFNLRQNLKDKDEEIEEIVKDFEEKIKEMNDTIHNELEISYNTNVELHDENTRLKAEIDKLKKENKKYKQYFSKDSTNSSIPPSKDEFRKVANSRKTSTRTKGGQTGHTVHRSKCNSTPHKTVYKMVTKAPTGAVAIFDENKKLAYYVTQEINANFKTEIIETRYLISDTASPLSEKEMKKYAINPVSYHDDFKSMIIYLNSKGTIALKRLCTMINEMSMGVIDLKQSTVVNWTKEFTKKSQTYREDILSKLLKEDVLYVDETGWKISGKCAWLHVIASKNYAYFIVTKSRGSKEEGPLHILKEYIGCLIHDHYKPYYNLLSCTHGKCNAHILRYLQSGVDLDENEACAEMIKLLQEMIHDKKVLIDQGILEMKEDQIKQYENRYLKIINDELEKYKKENPVIPKAKYIPAYIKLMNRIKEYSEEHLRFIKDFRIPADNNLAERQMRPTKAKKKISGQSVSIETANDFAAIHTLNQTCSLQGINTLC